MRALLFVIVAASLTSACATAGRAPASQAPDIAVERGLRFAQRACAGCHEIGASGESPRATAPNFGRVRLRYTEPQLLRRLANISDGGHYEMPPIFISDAEAQDLAAYVESLGG